MCLSTPGSLAQEVRSPPKATANVLAQTPLFTRSSPTFLHNCTPFCPNTPSFLSSSIDKQLCIGLTLLECSILRPSYHTIRKPKLKRQRGEARDKDTWIASAIIAILLSHEWWRHLGHSSPTDMEHRWAFPTKSGPNSRIMCEYIIGGVLKHFKTSTGFEVVYYIAIDN